MGQQRLVVGEAAEVGPQGVHEYPERLQRANAVFLGEKP
jgi:hypothetical protein